jgi:hypothetical protein
MRTTAIAVLVLGCLTGACQRQYQAGANGKAVELPPTSDTVVSESALRSSDLTSGLPREVASPASVPRESEAGAFREITLPTGTVLPLVLDTPVASDTSRVEQAVRAHLSRPVTASDITVLPTGSVVNGIVTSVVRSGKVKGRAHLAVRFDSVTRRGESERYRMATAVVSRTAEGTKKNDTLKVVAPAAGGAIIGSIVGGGKGAAIGTAAGAGAGGAVVMSTRGKEVRLGKGALVSVRLTEPLVVRVPRG